MYHGIVLNVDAVANGDGVHIATQHGAKPNAAVVAHGDIAYHHGVLGKETALAHLGDKAPHFLNDCHIIIKVVRFQ